MAPDQFSEVALHTSSSFRRLVRADLAVSYLGHRGRVGPAARRNQRPKTAVLLAGRSGPTDASLGNIVYRRAEPADREGIIALSNCFPDDWIPYVVDEALADSVGGFVVAVEDPGAGCSRRIIAVSAANIVGESAWLEAMRVHPERQGHGIATELTRRLLNLCREAGCRYARLTTAITNAPVHHFIGETLGFRPLGRWFHHDDIEDLAAFDQGSGAGGGEGARGPAAAVSEAFPGDEDAVWDFLAGQARAGLVDPPGLMAPSANPWRVDDLTPAILAAFFREGHVLVARSGAPQANAPRPATGIIGIGLCSVAILGDGGDGRDGADAAGAGDAGGASDPGDAGRKSLNVHYLAGGDEAVAALLRAALEAGRRDRDVRSLCLSLPWSQWEAVRRVTKPGWPVGGHSLEAVIYHKDLR